MSGRMWQTLARRANDLRVDLRVYMHTYCEVQCSAAVLSEIRPAPLVTSDQAHICAAMYIYVDSLRRRSALFGRSTSK